MYEMRSEIWSKWVKNGEKVYTWGVAAFAFIVGCAYSIIAANTNRGSFYHATEGRDLSEFLFRGLLLDHGLLYATVNVFFYLILRFFMNRFWALLFACSLIISPFQLSHIVPSLYRDYAKTSFLLAGIYLILRVHFKQLSGRQLMLTGLIMGFITGIGCIVRADLLVLILPFIVTLFIFSNGTLRSNLMQKFLGATLCIATTVICFKIRAQLVTIDHYLGNFWALYGITDPFTDLLMLASSGYSWGQSYSDSVTFLNVHTRAHLYSGFRADGVYSGTSEVFASTATATFYNYLLNFPGDVLVRVYSAVTNICELPWRYSLPPVGIESAGFTAFYRLKYSVFSILAGNGLVFVLATISISALRNLRTMFFLLLMLVFFCGYTSIQFSGRHYFHLECVSLCGLGFVLSNLPSRIRHCLVTEHFLNPVQRLKKASYLVTKSVAVFASIFLVGYLLLFVARLYQSQKIKNMIQSVKKLDHAEIKTVPLRMTNSDKVFLPVGNKHKNDHFDSEILSLKFNHSLCDSSQVHLTLRYARNPLYPDYDYLSTSLNVSVPKNTPTSTAYFQVSYGLVPYGSIGAFYKKGPMGFLGFELPRLEAACIQKVKRVLHPERLSFLPNFLHDIISDPTVANEYQSMIPSFSGQIITLRPESISSTSKEIPYLTPLKQALPLGLKSDFELLNSVVDLEKGKLRVQSYFRDLRRLKEESDNKGGYATSYPDPINSRVAFASYEGINVYLIDSDLFVSKKVFLKKGDSFIVRGRLISGGFYLALIGENSQPADFIRTNSTGRFQAIFQVPRSGFYQFGAANYLDIATSAENHFEIYEAGHL